MSDLLPLGDDYADEFEEDVGDDACFWCDGEGYEECPDPLECTKAHIGDPSFPYCKCGSCGGTGNAKDMTIW